MTRRTRKVLIAVVVVTALVALPTAGTLVYDYVVTIERSRAKVETTADMVAREVAELLLVAEAALADVAFDARTGCTPDLVREFRNKVIAQPAIQGMGLVKANGQLACTAFGMTDPPIDVEPAAVIEPADSILRFTPPADLPYAPTRSFAALYPMKGGGRLAAAMAPATLFGFLQADVLGDDGHIAVTLQGSTLADFGATAHAAGSRLVATTPVGLYGAEVTASATRSWALAPWRENAKIAGLLGALAALAVGIGAARYARNRFSLGAELKEALANKEFEIWYQPVVDLQRERCAGAEALIRWRHPERDLIPPDLFIAMAEDSGIIVPMTRWLMERVGEDMAPLLNADPTLHIAINLAPIHMSDHRIVEDARAALARYGVRPSQILFELTERGLIDDPGCREVVEALGQLGSEVALDDFGTGYSSLAYIDKFKLDYLKIDKAFVSAIGTASPSVRLTDIIIEMATSLNLKLIAEGVETAEQAAYLRTRGVTYAQGWHFSKPLATRDFYAFCRTGQPATADNRASAPA